VRKGDGLVVVVTVVVVVVVVVTSDSNNTIQCNINTGKAVTLGGAYDVGGTSPEGLQGHEICCSGR